ncbi:MAG: tetratricopeptide repeat protein [Candidatus Cloacimonetes bacterium]|nr:tetratricopeptide repeat protein [Candidatus Cloacimonadota bacterium]MCF7814165.1 tetratricopeptide repeat protein [Candidatus Cloacimonadota bacterium]MCF7868772.1 tetratricopeptide repeat protein [Candidatus Cloacimonadota bacterium]MCF7884175.1 tetratricopeptide repeat protein [Candidatus Cloacimonadota bacterium]
MKKLVIILIIIFCFSLISAQTSKIDSLDIRIENTTGKEKVDALNDLSKAYWQIDPTYSVEYGETSRKLARKEKYKAGEAKALNNIGVGYFYLGDSETGMEFLMDALELRKEIGDKKEIVTALNNIGIIYDAINDYNNALKFYLESLKIEEEIGNDKGIAGSLNNIGIVYENLSNFNKALEYFLRSLQIYEKLDDKVGMAATCGNIGLIYGGLTNYDKALEYHFKALNIYEEVQDLRGKANILGNIGIIYDDLGNNDMALEYYLKSLKFEQEIGDKTGIATTLNNIGVIYDTIKEYEKAIEYYQGSLNIYGELNDVSGVADANNNIGVAYKNLNDYKKALKYLLNALDKYRELGRVKGIAAALNNVGTVYYELKNYSKAEEFLLNGLKLARQIEIRDLIIEIYLRLSDVKVAQQNYQEALKYHKLYSSVKDSIFSSERMEIIAGMEATYEVQLLLEEREKEIELLQKDNEIYKLQAEKQRLNMWLLYFGLAIVIVLAFVIFYRYRLNKKNTIILEKVVEERTKDLRETNDQLKKEITERKQLENQLIRSERLAGVGELAAGIAHEIRNPLGNISSSAQICLSKYNPQNQIKDFLGIIQEESDKANAIIKGLLDFANPREVKLKKDSVCKVIKEVLNSVNARLQENQVNVELDCSTTIPRIMLDAKWLQQAFQNFILNSIQAMPNGGKLKISGKADFKNEQLTVIIEDSGFGISQENLSKIFDPFYTTREDGVGLGLSLCHQIISDHNGNMQIESEEKVGTKVYLTFPISNN